MKMHDYNSLAWLLTESWIFLYFLLSHLTQIWVLSQTKIINTVLWPFGKTEQIQKVTIIFIQNNNYFHPGLFWVIISPFRVGRQFLSIYIRGRSQTTLTRLCLFLTTYPPPLTFSTLWTLTKSQHILTTYPLLL